MNPFLPFWVLTIAVFIWLLVPVLVQEGMFTDGVLYASIARNLAEGIGTFWYPKFSSFGFGGYPTFHGHPPLALGIQAIFFHFLGDKLYVERLYSFLTACLTAGFIILTWRWTVRDQKGLKKLAWIPVLLWIIMPVSFWSYQNNMLENTMGVFTLLAVYFTLRSLEQKTRSWLFLLLAGICVFLASFSKGLPGFFPIAVPGFYWVTHRNSSLRRPLVYTLVLILIPIILYFILMLIPDARESLSRCVNLQLHRAITASTVNSRFYIVGRLLWELSPALAVIFFFLIAFRPRVSGKSLLTSSILKKAIFYILVGCSGALPFMLTKFQKGYFLVPSLPFFAIGLALVIAPYFLEWLRTVQTHSRMFIIFFAFCIVLLASGILFSVLQWGRAGRDKELLRDVHRIGQVVPPHSIVRVSPSLWNHWLLQAYLMRYYHISLDPSENHCREYYLTEPSAVPPPSSDSCTYKFIPLDLETLALYGRATILKELSTSGTTRKIPMPTLDTGSCLGNAR